MPEVVSFGNIVNSLRSVRNNYNEHLKTVPQYEVFLLVESLTPKVADTLRGIATDVTEALETARSKFRQHLTSIPEYRALLAIDKLIIDISTDLGVQTAPATKAQENQISGDLNATHRPDQIEQGTTDETDVSQAEPAQPDAVAQTDAEADLNGRPDPISRIQTALRPAEDSDEDGHHGNVGQTPLAPNELIAQARAAEPNSVLPPTETSGEEAGRAA